MSAKNFFKLEEIYKILTVNGRNTTETLRYLRKFPTDKKIKFLLNDIENLLSNQNCVPQRHDNSKNFFNSNKLNIFENHC